jgi:hypothetical protein
MKQAKTTSDSRRRRSGIIIFSLVLAMQYLGQNASAEPKFWKESPDQAQVLAATFIGGKGNEWLVGGGFQPDGTIVLVGNVVGLTFELPVPVQILGTDLPAPPEAKPVPEIEHGKGGDHQKVDKQNQPVWEKPSWRHEGVTGFVLRCSPDLKKILSAHRLPWTAGALTSAVVGADGSIYISGRAGDGIAHLGGAVEELSATQPADKAEGRCQHAFVAKLSADASASQWVRHSTGPCDAPQVAIQGNGKISFSAQQIWAFDPTGKLLNTVLVPGGAKKTTSVSPIDGSIIVAGEHHWPTGREPWRCPTFNVQNPDGSLKYQLYDWGGPFVGLDSFRLVSDSAVRFVTHDRDGNILLYAWSDGGNSVMNFQPQDVRAGVGMRGLGLSTAGAGVLSAAYLIRLEPKDYRATAFTLWLSFTERGKPNSIWIDNMAVADDGTVFITGRAAWELWQTHNKLSDARGEGQYIAVLSKDLDQVRFCSVVPGAGAAEVSYERAGWGIATGLVSGHRRAIFVGGAAKDDGEAPQPTATPTRNAMQGDFGGGWSDGYVVLLDLGEDKPSSIATGQPGSPMQQPSALKSATFEAAAPGKNKKTPPPPADATAFLFKGDVPKWVTVEAEFRDQAGRMWTSFLYGKPIDGSMTYQPGELQGGCSVACTEVCQPRGDQSRRILGELFRSDKPPQLRFTLELLGKIQTTELTSEDAKGHPQSRTVEFCQGRGTLEVAGKEIPVTPRVTFGFGKSQGIWRGSGKVDKPANSLHLDVWTTLKASDLGIKAIGPDDQIDVRISMSGVAPPERDAPDTK